MEINMKSKIFKSISIILSLVLLCSVFVPYTVFAAEDAKIIVSTETAKAGETVDITVSLNNNPGIVSATMNVKYDDSALTLTKVTDAGVLGAQSHKPEYTSPYTLAWANDTATSNYTVNGTIVTLTFKVSDNAQGGKLYPVELSYNYNNYDIYDKDVQLIKFDVENGGVNVEKSSSNPVQPTEANPSGTTITPGFYLVGSEAVCGVEWGWEKAWENGTPMSKASDGTYFKVYNNIKSSKGNTVDGINDVYAFKVVYVDASGKITWHPGGMGNNTLVVVLEDNSTVLFQFKLLAASPTTEGASPEAVIASVYGPNETKPDISNPNYPEKNTVVDNPTTPANQTPTQAPTQPQITDTTDTYVAYTTSSNSVHFNATGKKVKAKALKKKTMKVASIKIINPRGKVTIAKVKNGTTSKIYKKLIVTKTSVKLKRGTYKKGTYKVKIKVTAAGTTIGKTKYLKGSYTKTVKFKIK